ncbi:hypothetical protein [Marinomonas sp.]
MATTMGVEQGSYIVRGYEVNKFKDFLEKGALFQLAKVDVSLCSEGRLTLDEKHQPDFFCLICNESNKHDLVADESKNHLATDTLDLTFSCRQCVSAFKHISLRVLSPRGICTHYDHGRKMSMQKLSDSVSLCTTGIKVNNRVNGLLSRFPHNHPIRGYEYELDTQKTQ